MTAMPNPTMPPMPAMVKRRTLAIVALVGLAAGCGSSGGAPGGSSGGEIVWKEDGASQSVPAALATTLITSTDYSIEIAGAEISGGRSIGIVISSESPLGGTYTCGVALPSVEITYLDGSQRSYQAQSCSVTLTITAPDGGADAGAAHAVGTFTIVLTASGGVTKNLTGGTFDVPVSPED